LRDGYKLTVTQLNEYVNGLLRGDALLGSVCVCGELSGFKRHSSGHLYFSLKDQGALVRCVMFRQSAYTLDFSPEDGQSVTARGSVSLYVKDGQYQLYVTELQREGEGELYRRFLLLKTRLEARGYFDAGRKRPIPALPECVGIITSPTGAAIQDIINISRRRFPGMNLLLCPARVQGAGAAEDIAGAITAMNRLNRCDVLIVGRGGGSLEDLWPFNEEIVARAIYESSIPVVSAVGHETDYTIADFVADLRAPTPSAAAELCVPEYNVLRQGILGGAAAINYAGHERLSAQRRQLQGICKSAALARVRHEVELRGRETAALEAQLKNGVRAELANAAHRLEASRAALEALSPRGVLRRGYGMVSVEGRYAGRAAELPKGGKARLTMYDGAADITIDKITTGDEV